MTVFPALALRVPLYTRMSCLSRDLFIEKMKKRLAMPRAKPIIITWTTNKETQNDCSDLPDLFFTICGAGAWRLVDKSMRAAIVIVGWFLFSYLFFIHLGG